MTILAFWTVDSCDVERHTLDDMSDLDAFDILWHKRDELRATFYDINTRNYGDPMGMYGIGNASDFEQDYNDEELDGGMWTKVIHLDEDYVKQIINE